MKIVIPTNNTKGLEDKLADHFGRCLTYTFLDEKGNLLEVINNTCEHMGGTGLPPELMKKHGADILLCKDLGPRALAFCQKLGIDVFICRAESVKDCFKLWHNNQLEQAGPDNVCQEHRH